MPILTVPECKSIWGVSTATGSSDTRIADFIKCVQDDITYICANDFSDDVIYRVSGGSLAFVRGATDTTTTRADEITDAESYFSTAGFAAGQDIIIIGGSNEGIYQLAAVSSAALTLTSSGDLIDQSQIAYHRWPGQIGIGRVKWPKGIKPVAAHMVKWLLDGKGFGDAKSESIDDYSIVFAGQHAYPKRLLEGLRPYRRAVLI